jgi:hypothetical protein
MGSHPRSVFAACPQSFFDPAERFPILPGESAAADEREYIE